MPGKLWPFCRRARRQFQPRRMRSPLVLEQLEARELLAVTQVGVILESAGSPLNAIGSGEPFTFTNVFHVSTDPDTSRNGLVDGINLSTLPPAPFRILDTPFAVPGSDPSATVNPNINQPFTVNFSAAAT